MSRHRVLPSVSTTIPPDDIATARITPRSLRLVGALCAYGALLLAAFVSGNRWLDALGAVVLMSVLLSPGLRRREPLAWTLWLCGTCLLILLAVRGGQLVLDAMPILVNLALCHVFARTLRRGREPLISRVITVLESPQRLASPGVAAYARGLTWAWALLAGGQAVLLAILLLCAGPHAPLASLGLSPPFALPAIWRWYPHLGSYGLVIAFVLAEYAYRRWHMRHLAHAPLPVFIARLARRWPALVHRLASDVD